MCKLSNRRVDCCISLVNPLQLDVYIYVYVRIVNPYDPIRTGGKSISIWLSRRIFLTRKTYFLVAQNKRMHPPIQIHEKSRLRIKKKIRDMIYKTRTNYRVNSLLLFLFISFHYFVIDTITVQPRKISEIPFCLSLDNLASA